MSILIIEYVYCDRCNKDQEHTTTGRGWIESSLDYAHNLGWEIKENSHICTDCQDEVEE